MSLQEAEDYCHGQDRRHRQSFEVARWMLKCYGGMKTGEEIPITLPWDEDADEDDYLTEEEAKELLG